MASPVPGIETSMEDVARAYMGTCLKPNFNSTNTFAINLDLKSRKIDPSHSNDLDAKLKHMLPDVKKEIKEELMEEIRDENAEHARERNNDDEISNGREKKKKKHRSRSRSKKRDRSRSRDRKKTYQNRIIH